MKLWKTIGSLWLSRKLWTMLAAVAVLWGVHERSIMLLYTFTYEPQITAFLQITITTLTAIAAVVTAYMGIQGFAKSTLTTVLQSAQESTHEHIVSESTEKIVQEYAEKYRNDPSYRPIQPDTEEPFR